MSFKITRRYGFALIPLLILGGWMVWYQLNLRAVAPSNQTASSFTIAKGDRARDIATRLEAAHLIRSRSAFLFYLDLHGVRAHVQSGSYELKPSYPVAVVTDIITNGRVASSRLTVPEGATIAKIETLAENKGIHRSDFEAALKASYSQSFLATRPAGATLEGYLFPDSYQLTKSTSPNQLIAQMLATFDARVTPELRTKLAAQGLSLHQGITLASIVEREVSNPADRPIVAQIFLNRIHQNMPLQSDVTVIYAADLLNVPFNVNLDSPYNTYLHAGLPPGPISNPGTGAITAVANPQPNDYLYFLAGRDGKTYYAKTFAEHQRNVAQYL